MEINDKYRLYWAYDSSKEMFYFTVVVQTTGWIAFGVSNERGGMRGYDVMVGGVDDSGNGYIAVRKVILVRTFKDFLLNLLAVLEFCCFKFLST